ncbi:MAG: type II toxin-antitoxin system VapC family toxin [Gemmatimonadota bacterium]
MILVDTSVRVDHLRRGSPELARLLEAGLVRCHPLAVGELACGRLTDRVEILALLDGLPRVPDVDHEEVLAFVERAGLDGSGIGWIHAHLLASARLAGIGLWTLDLTLERVVGELGMRAGPPA